MNSLSPETGSQLMTLLASLMLVLQLLLVVQRMLITNIRVFALQSLLLAAIAGVVGSVYHASHVYIIAGSAMAEMVISRLLPMPPNALPGSSPPSARKNRPSAIKPTTASAPPNKLIGAFAVTIGTISPADNAVRNST